MLPPAAADVTKCHPCSSSLGNLHALLVCDSFNQMKEFCGCGAEVRLEFRRRARVFSREAETEGRVSSHFVYSGVCNRTMANKEGLWGKLHRIRKRYCSHEQYAGEQKQLGDQKLAIIQDYAKNFMTMDDAKVRRTGANG